jgi:hypothetical protein
MLAAGADKAHQAKRYEKNCKDERNFRHVGRYLRK